MLRPPGAGGKLGSASGAVTVTLLRFVLVVGPRGAGAPLSGADGVATGADPCVGSGVSVLLAPAVFTVAGAAGNALVFMEFGAPLAVEVFKPGAFGVVAVVVPLPVPDAVRGDVGQLGCGACFCLAIIGWAGP